MAEFLIELGHDMVQRSPVPGINIVYFIQPPEGLIVAGQRITVHETDRLASYGGYPGR